MKIKVVYLLEFILVSLFLTGFSSAACALGQSDVIMRLSASTNAHGADYTNAAYSATGIELCYSNLFNGGVAYTGPNNPPQACIASNVGVFWLSASTNAHASTINGGAYNTPICYGDLTCYVDTNTQSLNQCYTPSTGVIDTASKVLVRLSSTTNAHLQDGSYTGPNLYGTKICCYKSGNPVWRDSAGNVIPNAGSIRLGSFAYATLPNYNGASSFSIKEDDGLGPLNPSVSGSPFTGTNFGPDSRYNWSPTQADINAASGINDPPFEFYFTINGKTSPHLNVTYCGDGRQQEPYEQCDDGSSNGQLNPPIYGLSNGYICSIGTCQKTDIQFGKCGDGNIDTTYGGSEACDCGVGTNIKSTGPGCSSGLGNGQPCTPDPITGTCQLCTSTCSLSTYNGADLIWTDTSGTPISQAEVDDVVLLVYPNAENDGFTSGTFSTYEWDLGFDEQIKDITNGQIINGNFIGSWKIDSAEAGLSSDKDNFRFRINGKEVSDTNELLILTTSSDDRLNAEFTNLVCGDELILGSGTNNPGEYSLDINYDVDDNDDLSAYVLKINGIPVAGDTDGILDDFGLGDSYTYNINLTSAQAGTVNVRLEAVNTRGEKVTDIANLILIDPSVSANYIAACISSPENYANIDSDYALFDATTSKAITYTSSGVRTQKTLQEMSFVWKFSDGSSNPYDSSDPRAYSFEKYFPEKGANWANLEIGVI